MLSGFVKKLIFAREFDIDNGAIRVLNTNQTMISLHAFLRLIALDKKNETEILKSCIAEDIANYEKRLGVKKNTYEHIPELFELFGLGKLVVIDMDQKEKKALVEIHNSPLPIVALDKKIAKEDAELVFESVLRAVFSYVFGKDVNANLLEYNIDKPCKFVVK